MGTMDQYDSGRERQDNIDRLVPAADKGEPEERSGCPGDSELAALLEGQSRGEERKRLQAHISSCDECRRRCLQVGMALMEVNRSPRRRKVRIYTWASVFLAAAACVALFLYMGTTPPWFMNNQPVLRESTRAGQGHEKTPAPPTAPIQQRETASAGQQVSSRIEAWYDLLRQACARGEKSPLIWQALYGEGKRLAPLAPASGRRDIEALLARMRPDNRTGPGTNDLCVRLQRIIGRKNTP
jgi:hypothetical protein